MSEKQLDLPEPMVVGRLCQSLTLVKDCVNLSAFWPLRMATSAIVSVARSDVISFEIR